MREDRDFTSKQLLLDPFSDPEPSEETGPGTHFRSTYARMTPEPSPPAYDGDGLDGGFPTQTTGSSSNTNPFRRKPVASRDHRESLDTTIIGSVTDHGQLTPPSSSSPRHSKFPTKHRPSTSVPDGRAKMMLSPEAPAPTRTRSTSLTERYPGDQSHRPLEILRRESRRARRAPHLRKTQLPGPDTIDRLDLAGFSSYHHEGPYDAALLARNSSSKNSPIAALQYGTEQVLRATPREAIRDSVLKHRPLDRVAAIPPGGRDRFGRRYEYDEGADLQVEAGYRRWAGVEYKDEDRKGKGEPSYTIEKALKESKMKGRYTDEEGIELASRPRRHKSISYTTANELEPDVHRSHSTGKHVGSGLKKRFGSLHRRKEGPQQD